MWEYWKSRVTKGKSRHPSKGGADDDSPGTHRHAHLLLLLLLLPHTAFQPTCITLSPALQVCGAGGGLRPGADVQGVLPGRDPAGQRER